MNRYLIFPTLLIYITFIGCTSNQTRTTEPASVTQAKAKTAYCPVNLFDQRDVLSCFDSRELCEQSIRKAPKYVCNPLASVKYPPKK